MYTEGDLDAFNCNDIDYTTDIIWVCPDCKEEMDYRAKYYHECRETKMMSWECKYCGENEKPKCHKCVREDGKLVSDELSEK